MTIPINKGVANLREMFARADDIDRHEGLLSYGRYNRVMRELAEHYGFSIDCVTAAFCALSPNNDYVGNLRSLVSLLHGMRERWHYDEIECSTYRHCLKRAHSYMTGEANFLNETRGRKIRSFYMNIVAPEDRRFVTVDGHVCAAWRGERLTMKEAIVRGTKEYDQIEEAIMVLACRENLRPNQYQAVVWFTRKRVFQIKAEMHRDLFLPSDDVWRTYRDVKSIRPFGRRTSDGRKSERPSEADHGHGRLPLWGEGPDSGTQ
jgi:hypothetical protein